MWLFNRNRKIIPIIGIRQAGKTYFLVSLGYLISNYKWGEVGRATSVYFNDLLKLVTREEKIPPTPSNYPIDIEIKKVHIGNNIRNCNISLSTEDFSGPEYENAMSELAFEGTEIKHSEKAIKFSKLYSKTDGIIVVIDIVREINDKKIFCKDIERNVRLAFSEQISPLARGIELTLRNNPNMHAKPIFFIFPKSDIHNLSKEEIAYYLERIMAITLARLENRGVNIKVHTVSSLGWGGFDSKNERLKVLESLGFVDFLSDLATIYGKDD